MIVFNILSIIMLSWKDIHNVQNHRQVGHSKYSEKAVGLHKLRNKILKKDINVQILCAVPFPGRGDDSSCSSCLLLVQDTIVSDSHDLLGIFP